MHPSRHGHQQPAASCPSRTRSRTDIFLPVRVTNEAARLVRYNERDTFSSREMKRAHPPYPFRRASQARRERGHRCCDQTQVLLRLNISLLNEKSQVWCPAGHHHTVDLTFLARSLKSNVQQCQDPCDYSLIKLQERAWVVISVPIVFMAFSANKPARRASAASSQRPFEMVSSDGRGSRCHFWLAGGGGEPVARDKRQIRVKTRSRCAVTHAAAL